MHVFSTGGRGVKLFTAHRRKGKDDKDPGLKFVLISGGKDDRGKLSSIFKCPRSRNRGSRLTVSFTQLSSSTLEAQTSPIQYHMLDYQSQVPTLIGQFSTKLVSKVVLPELLLLLDNFV